MQTWLIWRNIGHFMLGVAVTTLTFVIVKGCQYFPESSFTLANESRLPKYFQLTPGFRRATVSITTNYYITFWGGKSATFLMQDSKKQTIRRVVGKAKCAAPFQLTNHPKGLPPGIQPTKPLQLTASLSSSSIGRWNQSFT